MDERVVTVPAGRFHYLISGRDDAPLMLVLHGFPDCPLTFVPVLEELCAAGYQVAAPWLRGYRPSVGHGPYAVERLAVDVMEIALALSGERPVHLIGHDWGAIIAHAAAIDAPKQFLSVTTIAVPHPLVFMRALVSRPAQLFRSWYMLMFQLPRLPERLCSRPDGAFIDHLWRTWSPGYRLPDEQRRRLHQCLLASMPGPLHYYRSMARPASSFPSRIRELARATIAIPTLHIHGADDGCVGPEVTRGQERYFAGPFASEIWPGVGHFIHAEAPARLAARIAAFCGRHDQVGAG